MRHIRSKTGTHAIAAFIGVFLLFLIAPNVMADSCVTHPEQLTCSSHYGVSESFFGTGGLDTCPTQGSNAYCAKQSAGELTVGNTKGTAFQSQAGFNTDRTEWISAIVIDPAVNLGVLNEGETKAGTARFKVSSYLSNGYVVQIAGTPPTNSGHPLTAMSAATSAVGTEQFGLNLTANNVATVTPNTFGAIPTQDPDYPSQPFGFGTVATGYDTANIFNFNSGDTIASSTKSSSYTIYTISYIANISNVSPGGAYVGYNSIIATGTF